MKPESQSAAQPVRSRSKTTRQLLDELDRRLKSYALVAGATGVGWLALAQPARAEVVYTPTDIALHDGSLSIDLNADDISDFTLRDTFRQGFFKSHRELRLGGNAGASVVTSGPYAAALIAGSIIGSSRVFTPANPHKARMASVGYHCFTSSYCKDFAHGPWTRVRDHYLGLKFEIGGETHYGWARLNVTYNNESGGHSTITARLTGYAYETNPGQSITAGQTQALSESSAPDAVLSPSTLGALAQGYQGLLAEHRKLRETTTLDKEAT